MKRYLLLIGITLVIMLSSVSGTQACTLWGATGDAVLGGGSLIAKNRDWSPNHDQEIKVFRPSKGYKYVALYVPNGFDTSPGVRGGVNEKGFAVVNATASSIHTSSRRRMPHTYGVERKLLQECASVDEALQKIKTFIGPRFLLLADKQKIAVVEMGPKKQVVKIKTTGILYHTNHYIEPTLNGNNDYIGSSSQARYRRISQLLNNHSVPFTLDNFINISQDQHDGADDSIFRTGSDPLKTRTLSVLIIHIPPQGSPQLYAQILNPNEKEQIINLSVEQLLNKQR